MSIAEERLQKGAAENEELKTKLAKAADESRDWKTRYGNDLAAKTDEMEELR